MDIIKTVEEEKDDRIIIGNIIVDDEVNNRAEEVFINGNIWQGSSSDDDYIINSSRDTIIEGENGSIDSVSSIISYTLGDNIENLKLADVVKKETINGEKCYVYGNPDDNRWILDSNQNDDGALIVCRFGFNPTVKK